MKVGIISSLILISVVKCQCFQYISQWVDWCPDLSITRSFLNSNCSSLLNSTLSTMGSNFTIFAPTDSAWNSTFNMTGFTDFKNISCERGDQSLDCYKIFTGNLSSTRLQDVAPCLPLLSTYHIGLGIFDKLYNVTTTNTTTNHMNITIVPVALNQTLDSTPRSSNITQVMAANSTTDGISHLKGGDNSTATILNSYQAADGQLYLIDSILVPPLPLNYTLSSLTNSTDFLSMENSEMIDSLGNRTITVFMPVSNAADGFSNLTFSKNFNFTSYIVPEVLYLNQTQPTTANLTTLDGTQLMFETMENYTAIINGNATVIHANIPMTNGVLHLINGTIATANVTNYQAARSLQANMNHWRRWIHAQ